MFITVDQLTNLGACGSGLKWFERHFPDGAELIDVINHPKVDTHTLHWGMAHLTTTAEEQEAYWKKLKIDTPHPWNIYESDTITESEYVSKSSHVQDSCYIFSSTNIAECDNVSFSSDVERSHQIFGSEFVYDSARVLQGKNITQSLNIVNSDYVVRSSSVLNAAAVNNSHYIHSFAPGRTRQIRNSAFITDCVNIKNCLFCAGIQDKEYMIFNMPVEADEFELVQNQLKSLLAGWQMTLVKDEWPEHTIPLDTPNIQRMTIEQFSNLPERFWRWVKTLPNYDPAILYMITLNKNLLI